jgi:hypothetical protein
MAKMACIIAIPGVDVDTEPPRYHLVARQRVMVAAIESGERSVQRAYQLLRPAPALSDVDGFTHEVVKNISTGSRARTREEGMMQETMCPSHRQRHFATTTPSEEPLDDGHTCVDHQGCGSS